MRRTVVVMFPKGQSPRILTGVRAKDFVGRSDCLINPTLPKGSPPHCWRLVDGKIFADTRKASKTRPTFSHITIKKHLYIAEGVLLVLLSSLITYLTLR